MTQPPTMLKYEKLSHHEHVLKRPDMYIGNVHPSATRTYVVGDGGKIVDRTVTIPEGLLRIFIEPLSNAVDNVVRSREMDIQPKYIRVTVSDDGWVTIVNDGYTIPIRVESEDVYLPEMLFGQLLTSSNYDDTEERYTSGKNGVGVSITNIFSSEFIVKCTDVETRKRYVQKWKENMTEKSAPRITAYSNKHGYTSVSYLADFKRFGVDGYSADMIQMMYRHVIDAGMLTKVDVSFNGVKCTSKTLLDYARQFESVHRPTEMHYIKDGKNEIVIGASSDGDEFEHITFVNGISTTHGGVHVDAMVATYLKPMVERLAKQKKEVGLRDFKTLFRVWASVQVPNPEFSSQNKTKLTAPSIRLDPLSTSVQSRIMKWSFVEEGIEAFLRTKDLANLKKTEKKPRGFKVIKGYDPANLVGKRPERCTLILCEGLSAKAFAVTGITVGIDDRKGRDYWGIYALRGKLLNTRNASPVQIAKNKEIVDMIQIMNLRFDVDYSDPKEFATLAYSSILIMTDQDTDGFHISGLIMNFFHSMFPSLFYRPGFLSSMFTPIVNVVHKTGTMRFYNLDDAYRYLQSQTSSKPQQVKYLKGLGSSNDEDIRHTFGKVIIRYRLSSKDHIADEMDKVFHVKLAERRKAWLQDHDPTQSIVAGVRSDGAATPKTYDVPFEDFLNIEMIKFSVEDCRRNLPNMYDGLKESQRKILFAFTQKGVATKMKVSQWAGFVSERTSYHHGEQCLFDTITRMAQDFVGSNNVPLLEKDGQFGTRLFGGKDAASPRYIFARLAPIVASIFRVEDECILRYKQDDGVAIEPENYLPIIPMILVNGCVAIATGWSTSIACYNPLDIIRSIRSVLSGGVGLKLVPWYKGYSNVYTSQTQTRFVTQGTVMATTGGSGSGGKTGKGWWTVTELPPTVWIDAFKTDLEQLVEDKCVKTLRNYSTADKVHFEIQFAEPYATQFTGESDVIDFLSNIGMTATINTTNMVVLMDGHRIRKMDSAEAIVDAFVPYRLDKYAERKTEQLRRLNERVGRLKSKHRFVSMVVEHTQIDLRSITKPDLVAFLDANGFPMYDGDFAYLLDIPIYEFTRDHVLRLEASIHAAQTQYDVLAATEPVDMWRAELDDLEKNLRTNNKN